MVAYLLRRVYCPIHSLNSQILHTIMVQRAVSVPGEMSDSSVKQTKNMSRVPYVRGPYNATDNPVACFKECLFCLYSLTDLRHVLCAVSRRGQPTPFRSPGNSPGNCQLLAVARLLLSLSIFRLRDTFVAIVTCLFYCLKTAPKSPRTATFYHRKINFVLLFVHKTARNMRIFNYCQ